MKKQTKIKTPIFLSANVIAVIDGEYKLMPIDDIRKLQDVDVKVLSFNNDRIVLEELDISNISVSYENYVSVNSNKTQETILTNSSSSIFHISDGTKEEYASPYYLPKMPNQFKVQKVNGPYPKTIEIEFPDYIGHIIGLWLMSHINRFENDMLVLSYGENILNYVKAKVDTCYSTYSSESHGKFNIHLSNEELINFIYHFIKFTDKGDEKHIPYDVVAYPSICEGMLIGLLQNSELTEVKGRYYVKIPCFGKHIGVLKWMFKVLYNQYVNSEKVQVGGKNRNFITVRLNSFIVELIKTHSEYISFGLLDEILTATMKNQEAIFEPIENVNSRGLLLGKKHFNITKSDDVLPLYNLPLKNIITAGGLLLKC
jgi:hypothetical protein